MKILLAGGGSGGPVTPVLAVAQEIKKLKPQTEFLFVGTKRGPERLLVSDFSASLSRGEAGGIPFRAMAAAKWRRYFSLRNFLDLFMFFYSLLTAWRIIRRFRPDGVFCAGGFVAVPLCWVSKLMGVKIFMHQQDVRIGLANKLIAPAADQITTAFAYTAKNFYAGSGLNRKWTSRAEWVGNPYRSELMSAVVNQKELGLHGQLPVLLILGGATGAERINRLIAECLPELLKSHQVIHQAGRGKRLDVRHPDYHQFEIITPFAKYVSALKAADIVIARAGLSTITELSILGKAAIIIPMNGTHQEDNAILLEYAQAAVVADEHRLDASGLIRLVNNLNFNPLLHQSLRDHMAALMPRDAATKIAKLILKQINGRKN